MEAQRWVSFREAGTQLGQCSRPSGERDSYLVARVRGAGTLLGDTHAETGQAAFWVAGTQVEVVGPAVAAGKAFHLGLGKTEKRMCEGTQGCLLDPRSL